MTENERRGPGRPRGTGKGGKRKTVRVDDNTAAVIEARAVPPLTESDVMAAALKTWATQTSPTSPSSKEHQ